MARSATASSVDVEDRPESRLVALIADRAQPEIAHRLADKDLAFVAYDDEHEITASGSQPSSVVLWVEHSVADAMRQCESIARLLPGTPVVLVCGSIQAREVRAALAAGVAGIVVADRIATALPPCVASVEAGQICVPREHAEQVEPPALSGREKQILALVVMGYSNGAIAEAASFSPKAPSRATCPPPSESLASAHATRLCT